jgi:hypothetical protein
MYNQHWTFDLLYFVNVLQTLAVRSLEQQTTFVSGPKQKHDQTLTYLEDIKPKCHFYWIQNAYA